MLILFERYCSKVLENLKSNHSFLNSEATSLCKMHINVIENGYKNNYDIDVVVSEILGKRK